METVAFYSYKGGVGRTFTLVHLGLFLARLGRKVVLLDLDFTAPGIAAKLHPFGLITPRVGLLDYIESYFKETLPPASIHKYSVDASFLLGSDVAAAQPERLLFIPTGDTTNRLYWWFITPRGDSHEEDRTLHARWELNRQILGLFDTCGITEEQVHFFIGLLKQSIADLQPDYLLIDTPAGITPYGGIANLLLADKVVCFFGTSPDSIAGMDQIFTRLSEIPSARRTMAKYQAPLFPTPKNFRVFPVLTRIPSPLDTKYRPHLLEDISQHLSPWSRLLGFPRPHILHSSMDLELEETLLLKPTGSVERNLLSSELATLLGKIFPQEIWDESAPANASDEEISRQAWRRLSFPGSPTDFEKIYRIFLLAKTTGIMTNLSDDTRNVALKVDTFCGILSDIYDNISTASAADVQTAFTRAGLTCGTRFGKALTTDVRAIQPEMTLRDRLDAWCEFDTSVGFGNLSVQLLDILPSDKVMGGSVFVKSNFLASSNVKSDANLCALLSGYIQGVLGEILSRKVAVSHSDPQCMRVDHTRDDCVFDFKVESHERL